MGWLIAAIIVGKMIAFRLGMYWGKFQERRGRMIERKVLYRNYWLILHAVSGGCRFVIRENNGKFVMTSPVWGIGKGFPRHIDADACFESGKKWVEYWEKFDKEGDYGKSLPPLPR